MLIGVDPVTATYGMFAYNYISTSYILKFSLHYCLAVAADYKYIGDFYSALRSLIMVIYRCGMKDIISILYRVVSGAYDKCL